MAVLIYALLAGISILILLVQKYGSSNFRVLSRIPSPSPLAPYSRLLWAFPEELRGRFTLVLPELHKKLGPLVRIGPDEISFYSLDVYDVVHKVGSKFKKDPRVYGGFVQDSHPALFSITDPVEHSRRRKIMGQVYSRNKVPNLESLMLLHVQHFISVIKQRNTSFDLGPACRALEADIISQFSLGKTIGAIEAWSRARPLDMVAQNDVKATWMPILTSFPALCDTWALAEDLVFSATGWRTSHSHAMHRFQKWASTSFAAALRPDQVSEQTHPNLVKVLVDSGLHPETALAEGKENLGPGTDTTSATLAHILWALAHNQGFQEKLHQDLAETGFSTKLGDLEKIAKLKALVKEGVRWAGAAAASLPRIVPDGGVELHGKFIPAGTVLTSSPIWYLRDETAFPSPTRCDPYRWLTPDGLALSENRLRDRYYIPFSKGSNLCVGADFSYYELYLSVSQTVQHFRVQLPGVSLRPVADASLQSVWNQVPLPPRKEWVAAVVTQELRVDLETRVAV